MTVDEATHRINQLETEYEPKISEAMDISFEAYISVVDELSDKLKPLHYIVSSNDGVEWTDIQKPCSHMSMKDFIELCHSGMLIDEDGFGKYASKTKQSNIEISPSDIPFFIIRREEFTHVCWFNK